MPKRASAKPRDTAKEWRKRYYRLAAGIFPSGPAEMFDQMARDEDPTVRPSTPETKQPASERARLALALIPDAASLSRAELVKRVDAFLKNHGMPPVSLPVIMRASGRWSYKRAAKSISSTTPAEVHHVRDFSHLFSKMDLLERVKRALIDNGVEREPSLVSSVAEARSQTRPKRKIALQALAALFPQQIPNAASIPNKLLVRRVDRWIKDNGLPAVGDDTILRAAGRR